MRIHQHCRCAVEITQGALLSMLAMRLAFLLASARGKTNETLASIYMRIWHET
jgi:hypothetical protein